MIKIGKILGFTIVLFNINQVSFSQVWSPLGAGVREEKDPTGGIVNTFSEDTVNHLLYVGGEFYYAGDTISRYLAIWNGTDWNTVEHNGISINAEVTGSIMLHDTLVYSNQHGVGRFYNNHFLDDLPSVAGPVFAFIMYHDTLFAGGDFFGGIKKYNGKKWEIVGGGVEGNVDDFCIYKDKLIVGGAFAYIGDSLVNNIASWDGHQWDFFDGGVIYKEFDNLGQVEALTVYNDMVIAGGFFDQAGDNDANWVAAWDGQMWHTMPGICGEVEDLQSNGEHGVYAGGWFGTSKKDTCNPNRVAYWDGSEWLDVGFGVQDPVFSMGFFNRDLYVGGTFLKAGGVKANHVAYLENGIATSAPLIKENKVLKIFPNPSKNYFSISSNTQQPAKLFITDTYGRTVKTFMLSPSSKPKVVDVSDFSTGIYLVTLETAEERWNEKLVVEK
ncbi:MAG: T9SS type A sorting domain-containing protein [Chitinophagales bacterium]|nr:T9SS type A sorting domain-containing protein [Chitinophagales bacterium]